MAHLSLGNRSHPKSEPLSQRLTFVLLVLFIFAIPWEDTLLVENIGTISRVLGIATMAFGILAVLQKGWLRPPTFAHVTMLLYVTWVMVTSFWSVDPDKTLLLTTRYIQLLGMAWLIWEFAETRSKQLILMQAYVLGAFVSIIGTLQIFSITPADQLKNYARYAAMGFDPNDLALILAIGIPMAWYLGSRRESKSRLLWVNRIYIPISVFVIFLTASRGGFLAALGALLVIPLTLPGTSMLQRLAIIVGSVALVYAVQSLVPPFALNRISTIQSELIVGGLGSRGWIWQQGLRTFLDHPFLGVGAGTFGQAVRYSAGSVAHNVFISIMTEQGLIGLVAFLVLLAACVFPIRDLPWNERVFWFVLILTWTIGVMGLTWEFRKPTWVLLALLVAFVNIPGSHKAGIADQRSAYLV